MLVQNGGFETGDFSFWTLNGTTTSGGFLYNGLVNAGTFTDGSGTNFVHSGTYCMALGESGTLAYLSQTLSTFPGQGYLFSFWMNNIGGATPNQFQVNWNTNSPAVNTLFNQVNVGAINTWTNMLFIVTATGTNTILQFGAKTTITTSALTMSMSGRFPIRPSVPWLKRTQRRCVQLEFADQHRLSGAVLDQFGHKPTGSF